jgi:hypothetical protein
MHPDHQVLLKSFGGVDECWNGPYGLLSNLYGALGEHSCASGFDGKEDFYRESCDSFGVSLKIDPQKYVSFAPVVSGDRFIYHRNTGAVVFLGFQGALENMTDIEGSGGLLHKMDNVPDFKAWVERVAQEWMDELER